MSFRGRGGRGRGGGGGGRGGWRGRGRGGYQQDMGPPETVVGKAGVLSHQHLNTHSIILKWSIKINVVGFHNSMLSSCLILQNNDIYSIHCAL